MVGSLIIILSSIFGGVQFGLADSICVVFDRSGEDAFDWRISIDVELVRHKNHCDQITAQVKFHIASAQEDTDAIDTIIVRCEYKKNRPTIVTAETPKTFIVKGQHSQREHFHLEGDNGLLQQMSNAIDAASGVSLACKSKVRKLPPWESEVLKDDREGDDNACAMCNDELVAGDEVAKLKCEPDQPGRPGRWHDQWHAECLALWFKANKKKSCPVCRSTGKDREKLAGGSSSKELQGE